MEFGLYLRSFMSDRTRPLNEQIDDAIEVCHGARDAGFSAVSVPQHWVSYPTVWPQPFPMLARLAPETGEMRLLAGIILLPLHNPVGIAELTATLDHISKGRFILGVGLGYRETELEAAGVPRKERGPRTTESIELMKRLWTGEEVNFEGRYWSVHNARMGFTPVQKPHPPLWMACQSESAARRAGRLADAIYVAPQVGLRDVPALVGAYNEEWTQNGRPGRGAVAISRGVSLAKDRTQAIQEARAAAETSFRTYSTWNMQEETMVRIHISSDTEFSDWAVVGNGDDCVEQFMRLRDDAGVESVVMTFLNLPQGLDARIEYIQSFSERVIQRMK